MQTDYKALVADANAMLRDAEIGSRVERDNMIGHLVDAVEELSAALAERRITDRKTLADQIMIHAIWQGREGVAIDSAGREDHEYIHAQNAADAILALFSSAPTVEQVQADILREMADAIEGHWAPDTGEQEEIICGDAGLLRARADAIAPKEEN